MSIWHCSKVLNKQGILIYRGKEKILKFNKQRGQNKGGGVEYDKQLKIIIKRRKQRKKVAIKHKNKMYTELRESTNKERN